MWAAGWLAILSVACGFTPPPKNRDTGFEEFVRLKKV